MNEITTIDTNNYAAMAKAMGIANEGTSGSRKSSTLARLRIHHTPIMGLAEVNGKKVNVEVVEGGHYKLEIPDGPTYFASSVRIRPYMQRFMYKRFVKGSGAAPNRYVKTVMADDLNIDLKDNEGKFNCGKPAGYIKDFKSLPEKTQELIKQIKRVRVIFGTVELINPTDDQGNSVELDATPFIWEVDNRDAFKGWGDVFTTFAKQKRLPIQHVVDAATEERKLPNGNSFFLPVTTVNLTNIVEIEQSDQELFTDFMAWVQNYNEYIINTYAEKSTSRNDEDDVAITDGLADMIDIDEEEVA